MATFILGIGISIFGSVASNFGVNVQKYSQIKNKELNKNLRRPYFKQMKWWLGLVFVILGALCDFGSLSFAPQSVVMPVGSLTLVANVFFAHFWLGEELGFTDILGTSFIVSGAVIIAVAYGALGEGAGDKVYYDTEDLRDLFHRWIIFGYGMTVLLVLAFFLFVLRECERLVTEGKSKSVEYTAYYSKMHPLSYAAVAGIFGSFSVTFGKAIGELLAATASDEKGDQMAEPFFYLFLVCMVATILLQTHYLAHGLEFFDALFIVPVFQCFFIVLSILGGALYWEEMDNFNEAQWAIFPFGVLVTLYGVYLMSSRDMVIGGEDEKSVLEDGKKTDSDDSLADHPLEGVIRPRLASTHPRLAKALMPLMLLDNPVLRDPDQDGVANNNYKSVTGSSRLITRKSRLISQVGSFIPIFMDHDTGGISTEGGFTTVRFRPIRALRIVRRHHPAMNSRDRRKTVGAGSPCVMTHTRDASEALPSRLEMTIGSRHTSNETKSSDGSIDMLTAESRMHSMSMPSFSSTAFLEFADSAKEETELADGSAGAKKTDVECSNGDVASGVTEKV